MGQRVAASGDGSTPPPTPTGQGSFNEYTGTLLTPHPELSGWLASFGIALAFAAIVEWLSLVAPLPLGGDSGTWTALSYPFIFYPHSSQIVPFGYPPGLFPVLGFFVLLGGPLLGPRLYLGFVTVLLGLSTYVLGRSLFRFRVSAVLAEALLFASIPFDRIFFFGGYPTLLALVFSNLALAFGVRYVRGKRPTHLVFFWLATGATLLTHEFVGLALVVTLVIAGFFLLLKRQLPRTIILSRAGIAGASVAALGVGAYYLGTRFAHVAQNNYLGTNSLAHGKTAIYAVLYPLHLCTFGGIFGHNLIHSPVGSFEVAVATAGVLFFAMVALAAFKPKYLTSSVIIVGASILAVLGMAIGGWVLNIFTDYRRFAYSLYLPFLLMGLLAYDTVIHWSTPPERESPSTLGNHVPAVRASRPPAVATAPGLRRRRGRPVLAPVFAIAGAAVVLVAGLAYGYPGLVHYQKQYTGSLHSQAYVDAMNAIQKSGLSGSILSLSGGATQHWTFAMSGRAVYSPTIVSGFLFKKSRIAEDQLAFFPFNYRTSVSNGLNFASVTGNVSDFFDGAPVYGTLKSGTPTPVFLFPPQGFTVTLANSSGVPVPAFVPGTRVPSITVESGPPAQMDIHFVAPGYNLTVTSTLVPGGPTFINATAQATGPAGLINLKAGIRPVPGIHIRTIPAVTGNSFVFTYANVNDSTLTTDGVVAPPGTVELPPSLSADKFEFGAAGTNSILGSHVITLSIELTTPGANSFGSPIPPVITTPNVLNNWQTRFVLFNNYTRQAQKYLIAYFEQEYRATVLFLEGQWVVLLLPSPVR